MLTLFHSFLEQVVLPQFCGDLAGLLKEPVIQLA